jgi:hypothetical protein
MSKYLSNVTYVMIMGTSPKFVLKPKKLSHCRIMWIKDSNKFQGSTRIRSSRGLSLLKLTLPIIEVHSDGNSR